MKKIALLLVAAMLACVMTACGGGKEETHEFAVEDLAKDLREKIEYEDELTQSRDAVFYMIYGIDESLVKSQCSYFSTNATTEEIAVVECVDKDAAATVKKAFEERVEYQKQTFESYAPEEVDRLEKALITELGNYVVLCVTGDVDRAMFIIDQY